MRPSIFLVSTLDTKSEETAWLCARLAAYGVDAEMLDASLETGGAVLDGRGKLQAMDRAIERVAGAVQDRQSRQSDHAQRPAGIVGLGGGTGSEIILAVMRRLPVDFPKVLITPLPFDPRPALADNAVILVPTLVDICGLNATLRMVLDHAAALVAGLACRGRIAALIEQNAPYPALIEQNAPYPAQATVPSVGITALGATGPAVTQLVNALRKRGLESSVFHANGFGGAALAGYARRGAFQLIVDLTTHELTRIIYAGDHVDMPDRFCAAPATPRIVLPGGLNFLGLGDVSSVPDECLERPHYRHSTHFTHVKLTRDEMARIAGELAHRLGELTGPVAVLVPMGGFSHQDRPGGVIEDEGLRQVFLETMRAALAPHIRLVVRDEHICDTRITGAILALRDGLVNSCRQEDSHA